MSQTQKLTFSAMFIAIILLMALVPWLGFITIGVVSITIIHIPVLIAALSFKDLKLAVIAGSTFGIMSWIIALTRPVTPVDLLFQNPLISVVPRILFAVIAFYLFILLSKFIKNTFFAIGITAAIATLCHSVMVLFLLYIFGQEMFPGTFMTLLLSVVFSNGWIEMIIAFFITPPIVTALRKVAKVY